MKLEKIDTFNIEESNEPKENSYTNAMVAIIGISIICWGGAFVFYTKAFPGKLATKQEVWGQFGDFMGGTLNPIFALLGLVALLFTISIQQDVLKNSKKELAAATKAAQDSSNAIAAQNEAYRQHARLSVTPRLRVYWENKIAGDRQFSLTLSNHGLGPAQIDRFRIWYDDDLLLDSNSENYIAEAPWSELLRRMFPTQTYLDVTLEIPMQGDLIEKNSRVISMRITSDLAAGSSQANEAARRVRILVEYKSLYEETFRYEFSRVSHSNNPTPIN